MPACRRRTRSYAVPANGSSARRARSKATGRCAVRTSRPAAGPSSSRTTSTRTSTPRPASPCGWGVNHIYGTGAALPALAACGVPSDHPAVRSAVAWLDAVQRPEGSFGEDILSYADPSLRGSGPATPSQTAWALLGYAAAGEAGSQPVKRAVDWLCFAQRSNGDWDENHYTGTGFPLDFMIRYHLYRLHFPLMALGRLRERLAA